MSVCVLSDTEVGPDSTDRGIVDQHLPDVCAVCVLSDTEVGPDSTDRGIMDQHLPADNCRRWKQRPIAVYDSTILTARLCTSHAGMYAATMSKADDSP